MSPFVHAGIALAVFVPVALLFGPAAGAMLGLGGYWMREGTEAQYATRRPKSETWWVPFAPWRWPDQMLLDFAAPALAVTAAWAGWVVAWGG